MSSERRFFPPSDDEDEANGTRNEKPTLPLTWKCGDCDIHCDSTMDLIEHCQDRHSGQERKATQDEPDYSDWEDVQNDSSDGLPFGGLPGTSWYSPIVLDDQDDAWDMEDIVDLDAVFRPSES